MATQHAQPGSDGPVRLLSRDPGRRHNHRAEDLAAELRSRIHGEVRFDAASRALYASDLSMYRQVPIGVVIPRTIDDVVATVETCRRWDVPLLSRGTGTSLAGQTTNVAVVLDFSKYLNRIIELNPDERYAWVEPGVINDQLRDAAEQYHLTLAPDPATHEYCTLGGMIGNNSCGPHSILGGKTDVNVEELEILTYGGLRLRVGATDEGELERIIGAGGRRGEIYRGLRDLRDRYADQIHARYPDIPRRVSGYNLPDLLPENGFHVARSLVGSEGTCAVILRAKIRLIPSPPKRTLLVIGYPDPGSAGDQVMAIMGLHPIALEGVHVHVLENMDRKGKPMAGARLLPEGKMWLLVEFGGETQQEATEKAQRALKQVQGTHGPELGMKVIEDPAQQELVWKVREVGVGASRVPGVEDAWPSWEDSAVPPAKLGPYLRDLDNLITKYGYAYTLFGHFGQGCIHTRITFHPKTAEGVAQYRSFMEEASDLVLAYGGSLSGEHGDGQAKGELLPKMFGPELMQAFREFKSIWDPAWKLNPGKLIDANPLDQNLRTGPDYRPKPVMTHFKFPDDHGSLAEATERCFGVGQCRGLSGGTMCPSFMVTREEQYTTRGRARLLFEMLRGDVLSDGWRDEGVKDALDLCLACKGCKGDCPVAVDVATYKAEFLSHYYERRLRPRSAYALGLVFLWARLAAHMPGTVNFVTQTPVLSSIAKALAGIAPERRVPEFAGQSFQSWFAAREPRNQDRPKVILWPDTFNNYFHPETAKAAVEVLEAAGYQVMVPQQKLCCGRPLYDYGMLDQAKRQLEQILETLRPEIRAGVPLVGLEPSCVAVFRDELHGLLPHDEDAKRLYKQSYLLSEFLEREAGAGNADGYQLPKLARKAIVHGHCHHKAIMKMDAEDHVLDGLELDYQVLDSGCCGMAGSFGFEAGDHYDVSIKAGERVLLPAVRAATPETLVIANGFSCREQIAQQTDRRALHLAEVLHMALHANDGAQAAPGARPESAYAETPPRRPEARVLAIGAGLVGLLAAGCGLALGVGRRQ